VLLAVAAARSLLSQRLFMVTGKEYIALAESMSGPERDIKAFKSNVITNFAILFIAYFRMDTWAVC
jgi:hypothetical protein